MKIEGNKNIFCSVSAGYSSVLMAIRMKQWYPDHNIAYVMANTSKEREESLHFMNECDTYYKIGLKWVEAEFHEKGVGVSFNVVDYKDLKRNGEIFESGIRKFGIPSKINKWCNRDMKLDVMKKYADSVFGKKNYSIAVGLRVDEMDRIVKTYKINNVFYPLIDHNISSKDRNLFWSKQPIQITIPAYKGNCDMCFAKSKRKLLTVISEEPDRAVWWDQMIKKYSEIIIPGKNSYNAFAESGGMNFYRGNDSMEDLVRMAKEPFSKATDEYIYENDLFDAEDDCGSGCQVF